MNYIEKKAIADAYLIKQTESLTWDDLPDINSLHDCDIEEEIFEACNARLEEEGFPMYLISEE